MSMDDVLIDVDWDLSSIFSLYFFASSCFDNIVGNMFLWLWSTGIHCLHNGYFCITRLPFVLLYCWSWFLCFLLLASCRHIHPITCLWVVRHPFLNMPILNKIFPKNVHSHNGYFWSHSFYTFLLFLCLHKNFWVHFNP